MALAVAFTLQENQTRKENILGDNSRNSIKGKKPIKIPKFTALTTK